MMLNLSTRRFPLPNSEPGATKMVLQRVITASVVLFNVGIQIFVTRRVQYGGRLVPAKYSRASYNYGSERK